MSSINTSTTGTSPTSGAAVVNPSTQLTETSFLQLLTSQLKYQDPMSPTDSNAFIQEQAQFSTVEGLNNVESTLKAMQSSAQLTQAASLIGTTVDYTSSSGAAASGIVDSVTNAGGAVALQIGSDNVDLSAITKVSVASTPTTGGTTSGG